MSAELRSMCWWKVVFQLVYQLEFDCLSED